MAEQILESVRLRYGAVAESSLSSEDAGVRAVAEAFGYTPEELTSNPAEANMGCRVEIPLPPRIFGLERWSSTSAPVEVSMFFSHQRW